MRVSHATHKLQLKTGDWKERVTLNIADIQGHDVIFGTPWLEQHNPRVDWRTMQLRLTIGGEEVELKPASETPIDGVRGGARLSAMQVKRCFRKGERVLLAIVVRGQEGWHNPHVCGLSNFEQVDFQEQLSFANDR